MAASKREKWLQIRMNDEELALLDELTEHHEEMDRASMVRSMMKDFRNRMAKVKAKKAKEQGQ